MDPAASVREQSQIHLCAARVPPVAVRLCVSASPRPVFHARPQQTEAERSDRLYQERRRFVIFEAASAALRVLPSRPLTTAAAPASRRVRPHTVLDEMQPALSGRQLTLQQNAYAVVRHQTRQRGQRCHRQAARTHADPDGHRRMVRPSSRRHRGPALKPSQLLGARPRSSSRQCWPSAVVCRLLRAVAGTRGSTRRGPRERRCCFLARTPCHRLVTRGC